MMFKKHYKLAIFCYVLLCDRMVTGRISPSLTINKDVIAEQHIETMIHSLCATGGGTHPGHTETFQVPNNCKHIKNEAGERGKTHTWLIKMWQQQQHMWNAHWWSSAREHHSCSLFIFELCPVNRCLFLWTWSWKQTTWQSIKTRFTQSRNCFKSYYFLSFLGSFLCHTETYKNIQNRLEQLHNL